MLVPSVVSKRLLQVAGWLSDARTEDVQILDVEEICDFADHMVVASARSSQHVYAAASGLCWQASSTAAFTPECHNKLVKR